MELGTIRLAGTYKTPLEAVCSRADLKVKMHLRGLLAEEIKVDRKKLKRYVVDSKITSLKAELSKLIDLIGHILYKLYSKYTLYLLD